MIYSKIIINYVYFRRPAVSRSGILRIRAVSLKNVSFRVKIFIIIFTAIFVTTLVVSFILYKKAETAITGQLSRVVTNSMDFSVGIIDDSLQRVNGIGDLMLTDSELISTAEIIGTLPYSEKIQQYGRIRDLCSYFIARIKNLNMAPGIDSFYLYLVNQNTIIDSKTTYYENVDVKNVDFLQKFNDKQYENSWFESVPVDYYTLNNIKTRMEQSRVITMNKALKDKYGNVLAVLAMNISESYIADYYKKAQRGISGDSIILDQNGSVIAYPDKSILGKKLDKYSNMNKAIDSSKDGKGSLFMRIDNAQQFVVFSSSKYTNWRYAVMIPASDILGGVYQIQNFFILIIIITVLIILGITYLLSGIFYTPLDKLVHAMQEIERRNLNVRIDDKRKDEYQKVFSGFNNMAAELKNLIRDLTNEKVLKKEAEIKLLQAQVNPHFLYNTLDSIYSIARIKKVEEISKMVAALSKFFRISLSGGKDRVTLREALEIVENYLTIQNIRFKGKIDYQIDIAEGLKDYIVPKLVLQPIVENSISHGLESIKEMGKIKISAEEDDEMLTLCVEDNGVGMDEDKLALLHRSLEEENTEDPNYFALRNLNMQIKLKYGNGFGIGIESKRNEGTRTIIRLPIIPEKR